MRDRSPHGTGEGVERPGDIRGLISASPRAWVPRNPSALGAECVYMCVCVRACVLWGCVLEMMPPFSSVLTPIPAVCPVRGKDLLWVLWTGPRCLPRPGCLGVQSHPVAWDCSLL